MKRLVLFAGMLLLALSPALGGEIPRVMSYQGVLTGPAGQPVQDGSYILTYRIYDTNTGGTPLWAEAHQVVVFGGMFSVILGSQVSLDLPFDEPYWIGVTIDSSPELLPRRRLTTSAYSFTTGSVADNAITASHITNGAITPDKLNTTGAVAGQAMVFDGAGVSWSDVEAGVFALPFAGSVADGTSGFMVTNTGTGDGLTGISDRRFGVFGQSNSAGDFIAGTVGYAPTPHLDSLSFGVFGENDGLGFNAFAVAGLAEGAGVGVFGESDSPDGVGVWGFSGSGLAGLFSGHVGIVGDAEVLGYLFKTGGGFKIDHPLEPEDKYLYHFFVESPDMTNLYNGNVTLDTAGEAWVNLPQWFDALNRDFRYQLTSIGAAAPNLHVASKISGNRFKVAGGVPGTEVSWQVTGVRHDPYARTHVVPAEVAKPAGERGYYLHPKAHGQPAERSVHRVRNPRMRAGHPRITVKDRDTQR